jgi:hypothetical protein
MSAPTTFWTIQHFHDDLDRTSIPVRHGHGKPRRSLPAYASLRHLDPEHLPTVVDAAHHLVSDGCWRLYTICHTMSSQSNTEADWQKVVDRRPNSSVASAV